MNKLLTCPKCNKSGLKSLMSHIRIIHKQSLSLFLQEYPNTIMVSNDVKVKTSNSCINSNCGRTPGFHMSEEQKTKISVSTTGEKNHFYGKRHSVDTKLKMSNNHADVNGNKNPLVKWLDKDPKNREDYSKNLQKRISEKWKNETYRKIHSERLSKQVSKLYIDGFNPYSKHERGWFLSNKFSSKFFYQSSYERRFLTFCETSTKITSLQRVPFMIPYEDSKGIKRNYCSDFLINNTKIIEIKPKSMLDFNNNREKIAAAEIYCKNNPYSFLLITETELNDLDKIL